MTAIEVILQENNVCGQECIYHVFLLYYQKLQKDGNVSNCNAAQYNLGIAKLKSFFDYSRAKHNAR